MLTTEQRTCHFCGTVCGAKGFCPKCTADFVIRRDVAKMSQEEKALEMERWMGPLEIPFELLLKRIEELAGRGVWTHELVHPELLAAEIRGGEPIPFSEVLEKIPADKRVVVVEAE